MIHAIESKEPEIIATLDLPKTKYFIFFTKPNKGYAAWLGIGKLKVLNFETRIVRVDNAIVFDGEKFLLKDESIPDIEDWGEDMSVISGYVPLSEAVVNSIRLYNDVKKTPYSYNDSLISFFKKRTYTINGETYGIQVSYRTPCPDGRITGDSCLGYLPPIKLPKEEPRCFIGSNF